MRSRAQASAGPRRSVGRSNNEQNRGARQPNNGRRRLVRRSDRALRDNPVINGFDETEELVVDGYHVSGGSPQSLYNDDESEDGDEDSASDASDIDSSPEVARQRFQVRRTNVHDQQFSRQQEIEEERINRRTARMARRNELRRSGDSGTGSGRRD